MKSKGLKGSSPFRNITNIKKEQKNLDEYLKQEETTMKSYNFDSFDTLNERENPHKRQTR